MTQMFMSNLFSFIQLHLGRLEISSNICGRNSEWIELRWKKQNMKKDTAVYPVVDTTEFITLQHSL